MNGSDKVCATTSATAGWSTQIVATGANPSLALDASGQLHVACRNGGDVVLASWSGVAWESYFIDCDSRVGPHPTIAVDVTGRVLITYNDESSGTIRLASNR